MPGKFVQHMLGAIVALSLACGVPGASPSPQEPASSPTSSFPTPFRAFTVTPTEPRPTPSSTVKRRALTPRLPTPTPVRRPTDTPVPPSHFRPRPMPEGLTLAPNWLVFRPMDEMEWALEPWLWFTDGRQWIGPFEMPEPCRERGCEAVLQPRDSEWYACVRPSSGLDRLPIECWIPLPPPPEDRREYRQICQGPIDAPVLRCPLSVGESKVDFEVPNAFYGRVEDCAKCWVDVLVWLLEGNTAALAAMKWDKEWGPEEVPPLISVEMFILDLQGGQPRVLIPQEERVNAILDRADFSPDGRFLLVYDVSPMADEYATWVVSWPDGNRIVLPGLAYWLRPDSDR